ncbi:alpha/beta fold hydrolase [Paenibacillus anseongense]|uniref:alpha/beta fold hydrolase n=1 Tax=Paenibacillus anseongense TaxID=2682845 RepID=UPI002DB7638B|nr:alpha/beta fold hydrolase [Paenibacillus anseongense]MEC0269228.1 alpha/beta fold hydrolase [Paenibacillus anseongense]
MTPEKRATIVWLPGWSMPPEVFDQLCKTLPEYQHVYLDFSEAETPEALLTNTEQMVRKWKISALHRPLFIGGWSLGGLLALHLAARGLADGLILFAATARFIRSKDEAHFGQPDAYVRQMMKATMQDALAVETNFRQILWTETERELGISDKLPRMGTWTAPSLLAGLQILRKVEVSAVLSEIVCPVLLFHGREDRICPYKGAEELAAGLSRVHLYAIPDCGHAPFVGREEEIAAEMRRWRDEQQYGN